MQYVTEYADPLPTVLGATALATANQDVAASAGTTVITNLTISFTVFRASNIFVNGRVMLIKLTNSGNPAVYARIDSGSWVSIWSAAMATSAQIGIPIHWYSPNAAAGAHTIDFGVATDTDSIRVANSGLCNSRCSIVAVPV